MFPQMLAPEITKGRTKNTSGFTKCGHLKLHSVLEMMLDLVSGSLGWNSIVSTFQL